MRVNNGDAVKRFLGHAVSCHDRQTVRPGAQATAWDLRHAAKYRGSAHHNITAAWSKTSTRVHNAHLGLDVVVLLKSTSVRSTSPSLHGAGLKVAM